MNASTATARALVATLVRAGVTDVVLAPGSRSAPLAFALFAADRRGQLRLHVRVDERTAGFLALGLAKASGRPVPVVTTSGTAVVNLHPAVLEAHHAGVPLLALTADRPWWLRGTGANQTTDRARPFGAAVRLAAEVGLPPADGDPRWAVGQLTRALAAAAGGAGPAGPVHVDVAFAAPLVPDPDGDPAGDANCEPGADSAAAGRPAGAVRPAAHAAPAARDARAGGAVAWPESAGPVVTGRRAPTEPVALPVGPRTAVVAGDADPATGAAALALAERAGWPLLAEPSSNARSGRCAIPAYRLLLDHPPLADSVERVVVFGHPTASRQVGRLLARADVEVVVVSAAGPWPDPAARASRVVPAVTVEGGPGGSDDGWLTTWQRAGAAAGQAVFRELTADARRTGRLSGPLVAATVAGLVPAGGLLVAGSSNPVRDLDLAAEPWPDPSRRCLSNRGLSGIDGTVSTAVGAALAHEPGVPAYALLGDLTFCHDATGLMIGSAEPRPDLAIVVVNDGGGGIFHLLEQGDPAHAAAFERVFGTPPGVDLAALCAATGTPHTRALTRAQLVAALRPVPGLRVVEVPVDRAGLRGLHARLAAAAEAAIFAPIG